MDVHELAEGRITLDEAKVGDWFAPCCLHDLQRFESEHDLADMLAFVEEMGPIRVWRTCRDAVAELIPEEDADSLARLVAHLQRTGAKEILDEIERITPP